MTIDQLKAEAPRLVARFIGNGVKIAPKITKDHTSSKANISAYKMNRRMPKETERRALEMRAKGAKQCEIAEKLGVSKAWVSRFFNGGAA